jgi:hypothetical protein
MRGTGLALPVTTSWASPAARHAAYRWTDASGCRVAAGWLPGGCLIGNEIPTCQEENSKKWDLRKCVHTNYPVIDNEIFFCLKNGTVARTGLYFLSV